MIKERIDVIGMKIIILCFTVSFLCACNTIAYYENTKDKSTWFFSDNLTEDGQKIEIEYLQQWGLILPWHDFYMGLICEWGVKEKKIQYESIYYEIFNLKEEFIEPFEERININGGSVSKYYKYSIFFPNKILAKIEIKYYYNGKYYEYKKEVILTGKRNVTWWSQAKDI